MLKSVLSEEYPEAGYVGKCFAITKQAKQPGRDYNKFKIEEIEDPAPTEEKTATESTPVSAIGGGGKKR